MTFWECAYCTLFAKSWGGQLLQESDIRPFKIKYYCEKRDSLFESKMKAVANTFGDLRWMEGKGEVFRDYKYKRVGTVSLLAGIDLLTGEAIPLVSSAHKSSDFIEFLKI